MRFFEKTKGAISIFLVLIMLPMFTCAGLIVDGARISAARTAVTGAGDLTMNAALSEYENILLDVYGLFAMSESTEELEKNVSRYFSNTIENAGILESSDSYTRSFINSIGGLFSTDDASFDNIVDTQVESFHLVEVTNSALANPTVLERQIIEYMKYRGPISLGTGLLTKLGCIGETSKQTKAVEAKVDYEKKLDVVQDACEKAYAAINDFHTAVDKTAYVDDYLIDLANDLAQAKDLTKEMAACVIALKSPSLEIDTISVDSNYKKQIKDGLGNQSGLAAYNSLENGLSGVVEYEVNNRGQYVAKNGSFSDDLDNYFCFGPTGTIADQAEYAARLHKYKDAFVIVYTYLDVLCEYYNTITADELKTLTEEEISDLEQGYEFYSGQYSKIYNVYLIAHLTLPSQWKNMANESGSGAAKLLYDKWYAPLDDFIVKLQSAIDALDTVLVKVSELEPARNTWINRVDNLSEGEIKASMQSDYNNVAKDINKDSIKQLQEVLKLDKEHFIKIKEELDSVTFYNQKVCIINSESINYYNRFKNDIPKFEVGFGDYSDNTVMDRAESIMNKYVNANVKADVSPAKYTRITEDQQFYKYLQNACSQLKEGDEEEKKEAKSQRKELIDQGNADKSADTTGITTGNYVTGEGLTSDISAAIEALAQGQDAGANSFDPTAVDSSGDNKKMADDNKSNLTAISSLLENLTNIGVTARDKVYVEEYITEMFSCYTTGKDSKGVKSLSGHDMTTNKFYGSEIEYILYGFDTVQGNLNASKASIFGVRFALNSIYALTSSDTRTPALTAATAIAGWTGFGVPIVQTVILLAWSMAESMVDLTHLCNGESVVIYKSSETWVLGLNGLKNELKEIASSAVEDIFSKIEDTALDSIDSLSGKVNDYVTNTTEGIVDNIKGYIMSSIETLAVQLVGESDYDLTKENMEEKVDGILNTMLSSASGDSTADKATRLVIDAIKSQLIQDSSTREMMTIKDYIVSSIYSAYSDAKVGKVDDISTKVGNMLISIAEPIEEKIETAVSSYGDELKVQVSQIISEGGDQVKEKLTSAIENYMGGMSGSEKGAGNVGLASAFSLTYKEYLKAFTMMALVANETSMLKRCAELIQANVAQEKSSFDITQAFTMVEVNAEISIRTTFFDVPITTGVDAVGNPIYDLDFSNIGSGRQKIKYVGILGY